MSITETYNLNEGGEYINSPGFYDVQITDAKDVCSNSGTPGVKYYIKTAAGLASTVTYWLTPAAMPMLKNFAVACGLSEAEIENFQPTNLIGHQVNIEFVTNTKDAKYLDVKTVSTVRIPFELQDVPF
jgi:hypothetical protein